MQVVFINTYIVSINIVVKFLNYLNICIDFCLFFPCKYVDLSTSALSYVHLLSQQCKRNLPFGSIHIVKKKLRTSLSCSSVNFDIVEIFTGAIFPHLLNFLLNYPADFTVSQTGWNLLLPLWDFAQVGKLFCRLPWKLLVLHPNCWYQS